MLEQQQDVNTVILTSQLRKSMLGEFEHIPKIHTKKEAALRKSDSRAYTYTLPFFLLKVQFTESKIHPF